jgi:chloramphenicol-sensitive protein RarD
VQNPSDPAEVEVDVELAAGGARGRSGVEVPQQGSRSGLISAVAAYCLWGALPLYFIALAPAGAFEVVAWRIVFSLVFCAVLILVTRSWRRLLGILRQRRIVLTMGLAGALIYVNWQTYVYGALNGQVVEASLGYFINPIVTVFLGVFFLRERLRPAQWAAVVVSVIAVLVLAIGHGSVPWIALILAFSFGLYGYIKKQVGGVVDAVSGLTLETAWLTPVAIAQLIAVGVSGGLTIGTAGVGHTLLLIGAGVITAVPLLLFAAAARRLPLTWMGFIQYFAPIIQFVVGVAVLHEAMPPERWLGFGLVWLALAILTVDMLVASARGRRSAAADRRRAARV